MRTFRAVAQTVAGLALVTTVAACGAGVEGSAAAVAGGIQSAISASQPTGGAVTGGADGAEFSTEATSSVAPLLPVTREVGKTGWYSGFAITIDDVVAESYGDDEVDLTVNITYNNLGVEAVTPPEAAIEADGESLNSYVDAPGIPGGGKAKGTVSVAVVADDDEVLTPDQAMDKVTLVYGDIADNQTKIPLAEAGEVESVEPLDLTAAGTMTQSQIVIEVVSGTLVPSYVSGERGDSLLNLRIKVTCAPGCQGQGCNVDRDEFSLVGPDGSSVLADSRSEYCCVALYPGTVSDDEQNILTFVVASPGIGAYKLTYTNSNLTEKPATFDFTA